MVTRRLTPWRSLQISQSVSPLSLLHCHIVRYCVCRVVCIVLPVLYGSPVHQSLVHSALVEHCAAQNFPQGICMGSLGSRIGTGRMARRLTPWSSLQSPLWVSPPALLHTCFDMVLVCFGMFCSFTVGDSLALLHCHCMVMCLYSLSVLYRFPVVWEAAPAQICLAMHSLH